MRIVQSVVKGHYKRIMEIFCKIYTLGEISSTNSKERVEIQTNKYFNSIEDTLNFETLMYL